MSKSRELIQRVNNNLTVKIDFKSLLVTHKNMLLMQHGDHIYSNAFTRDICKTKKTMERVKTWRNTLTKQGVSNFLGLFLVVNCL